ncbi:MAG: hypothetical protein HOP30_18125 [Cyclobacteriaceae bacterium]|nr:hypothetical protein [Cyclobacteriaceae bacterium]
MKKQLFLCCFIWLISVKAFCQQLPYKANSEYEAKIDLSFREKPKQDNTNTFNFSVEKKRPVGPVAYLTIHFKMLISNGEVKIKMIQGEKSRTEKIKVDEVKKLEMGFIDELKLEGTQLQLVFLNDKKTAISQILISIEKDGTFLMNGERRGKF